MKTLLGQSLLYSFFAILLLCFGHAFSSESTFVHECICSGVMYNETKIRCYNEQEIGYISYTKMPLVPFYVLHTLYVYPQYRNQGYGTKLLEYACQYVKSLGATKLYIQPGPFEINESGYIDTAVDRYNERLHSLVGLYQKTKFTLASTWLRYCASLLYTCIRIDENPQYLMVRTFE